LLGVVLGAGFVAAQVSTGGIRGFVRDESGAVMPGVTVEAESPARIGPPAVSISNAQGLFQFENLPVGIYTVSFTMQGFASVKREGIRVEVGRSVSADQTLTVGGVEETVTVTGESPVVDVVHSGASTNFNQELLANAPTTRNQFFDAVSFAPAVKSTSANIGSSSLFTIYGSDSNQNAYQYDGVDVSAPSFGGPFDWPNYDMMQELQVKAVGASAEYAGFQGGAINLVLKSGSNSWRGSGSFYGIWNPLVGNNTPDEEFPLFVDHRLDYNYSLGGPIVKDRLWVLYIAEHIRWVRGAVGVPPDRPNKTRIWRPFVKVDARLDENDSIAVHYNDCRDYWEYGASKTTPPEASSAEVGIDPVVTARWTHLFGANTLLEVKGGGVYVRKDYVPASGDYDTPGRVDLSTGFVTTNRRFPTYRDHENRTNVNATVTHHADQFLSGSHDFKFGVQLTPWNTSTARGAYVGGVLFYDYANAPYYAVFQEPYANGGTIKTYGGFVQDDWTINDRVTLNLGLRYDRTLGSVPSLEQLDGRLEPTGVTFPALDDVFSFSDVSPRLGLVVKLDRSGKTVGKASWGRYYGKVIAPTFDPVSPGYPRYDAFLYNAETGAYDIPYYSYDPTVNYGIDPDLKNQYNDTYFFGIEREIQPNFGVTASFIYKKGYNFIRMEDVRGEYLPEPFFDTFEGRSQTLTVFNQVPDSSSLYQVTNRDDLDSDFRTFVVEFNKRWSDRWQVLGSYQWGRNWFYNRGVVGFNSQNFGTLNVFGQGGYGIDPNDLTNAYGPSSGEGAHAVRLTMTYEAPWGFHIGGRYFYESGRPFGRIINVPLNQGLRQVLAEPRGAHHLPDQHDLRLRIDKDFPFSPTKRLRLSLDLVNIFNSATPDTLVNNSSQVNYGEYLTFVEPRRAQVGIRFEF
jgi:outer membrane receptor protein involved in Fe transport